MSEVGRGQRIPARIPVFRRILLIGLVTAPFLAAEATSTGLRAGLDLTLEASAASRRNDRRATLHGTALGYAEFTPANSALRSLVYRAYGSALALSGHGPTASLLGDFLSASNIEGTPGVRLYSWWFEMEHRDWSLRAGALLSDEEFAGTAAGGNFLNSAFGWPAFISANTVNTGPAYYVPALGVRFEKNLGPAKWRAGIHDGDSFDAPMGAPGSNRHGLQFHLGGEQGWFAITEIETALDRESTRLKGGLWLHSGTFDDASLDDTNQPIALTGGTPRKHSRNYGAYVSLEHNWSVRGTQEGIDGFFRVGAAPGDRNAIGWSVDAGLSQSGLIPGRPQDIASIGIVHAAFSRGYADHLAVANPAEPSPDFEQVLEVSYSIQVSDRWKMQPDLQFIRHPGGSAAQRDALVFLLRFTGGY